MNDSRTAASALDIDLILEFFDLLPQRNVFFDQLGLWQIGEIGDGERAGSFLEGSIQAPPRRSVGASTAFGE